MSSPPPLKDRRGFVYKPAIGPRLKPWLWVLLIGFALLAANGAYLASVTFMGWLKKDVQHTYFSLLMLVVHLVLGVLIVVPFVVFGLVHWVTSRNRPNKRAIRYGLLLLACATVLLITGFGLWREFIDIRDPRVRGVIYWLHVLTPLGAIALYYYHRVMGPLIQWRWAKVWLASVGGFIALMAVFHTHDPRAGRKPNDPKYTFPSEVKLAGGKLIPEQALMMDEYCLKCHEDSYKGWFHSSHHFSSFNNKPYLQSVRETRQDSIERDGTPRAARWCAGCHDPVPFFSGAFDDPNYDDVNTRSSQAGITCTVCHAITHVGSTRGNADYTIEEPQHYPFAYSDNPVLQWVNNTLVKAKPEMHKRTFLKPEVHRNPEFCSTCHKVSLPFALNHYKDFLRGQNHWDTFVLSGVAGGNAKSFYYPDVAKTSCNDCHMPLVASTEFGAQDFDGKPGREVHNHLFIGANTGLTTIRGRDDIAAQHAKFLADKKVRVDIFGLREGGTIDGDLHAPLRPEVPTLEPGSSYLVETVVRTLAIGHPFSQGTADSNEIWVELIARSGDRVIGRSGGIGPDGSVDPYAHFINIYMLDRTGKRIDRRNPQDIFVPLYNKQVPPGAGQVVHFALEVPTGLDGPITLEARVNYRKFDRTYMNYVFGEGGGPELPVVVMASDSVTLPVAGGVTTVENSPLAIPDDQLWQRWNDYGIGLLLEGGNKGAQKGELKQAEVAFRAVAETGKSDGWVNLARVYLKEGRNDDALAALARATEMNHPAPWVINWLAAQVDERNGLLDEAIAKYRSVLDTKIPARKFDFSVDFEVRNALGRALWGRYFQEEPSSAARLGLLEETIATFHRSLEVDSENVDAHYGLGLAYGELARVLAAAEGAAPVEGESTLPERIAPEDLLALAERLAQAPADSAALGRSLAAHIRRFVVGPRPEFGSRTNTLIGVSERIADACRDQADPTVRGPLARALSTVHSTLHSLYRPDETAEGIAQKVARQDNPAANLNANSIVIHDLHRPGAPGIDVDATLKADVDAPAAGTPVSQASTTAEPSR
jgi:tetratricopeptide (TPR) repeat protein